MASPLSNWPDDLSNCTLEEALSWRALNRAWNKELRLSSTFLVNRRLANEITQADYLERRKIAQDDSAECRRRASALDIQIERHEARVFRMSDLGAAKASVL